MLLLRELQQDVADQCFVYASTSRVPTYHSGVVPHITSVITDCIHISNRYTRYLREMLRFLQHAAKPLRWAAHTYELRLYVHGTTINDAIIA